MTGSFISSLRLGVLAAIGGSLGACVTVPSPQLVPITDRATRYEVRGLSVPAPDGEGWVVAKHTPDQIVFARPGRDEHQRWAAWVQSVRSGRLIDGYFPLARFAARLERFPEPTPMTVVERDIQAIDRLGGNCIRRLSRLASRTDTAPSNVSNARSIDFFCTHPTDTWGLVWIHISETSRIAIAAHDGDLPTIAERFLTHVRFAPTGTAP